MTFENTQPTVRAKRRLPIKRNRLRLLSQPRSQRLENAVKDATTIRADGVKRSVRLLPEDSKTSQGNNEEKDNQEFQCHQIE